MFAVHCRLSAATSCHAGEETFQNPKPFPATPTKTPGGWISQFIQFNRVMLGWMKRYTRRETSCATAEICFALSRGSLSALSAFSVVRANSFSFRTLECLRQVCRQLACIFLKVLSVIGAHRDCSRFLFGRDAKIECDASQGRQIQSILFHPLIPIERCSAYSINRCRNEESTKGGSN